MATYFYKPTFVALSDNYIDPENAIDNEMVYGDTTTYAYPEHYEEEYPSNIVVFGCDNQELIDKIIEGVKILSIKFHCMVKLDRRLYNGTEEVPDEGVPDIPMPAINFGCGGLITSDLTQLDDYYDREFVSGTEIEHHYFSCPIAVDFINRNNVQLSEDFYGWFSGFGMEVYDFWWEFELEDYFRISTSVSPKGSGIVTGGGEYKKGQSVKLTATPNKDYRFVKWSDGNTSNPRTVTANGNATYTAIFEKAQHTITVKVSPEGSGTVTGAGTYDYGYRATITAIPNEGYQFSRFEVDGLNAPPQATSINIPVTRDYDIIAHFEKLPPPKFTETHVLYNSKQVSETNKVPAGQKFIVAVGLE